MKILAVIPAFCEESRVAETVRGVMPFVQTTLVIDDGSRDGTAEAARAAGAVVLRHAVNRGQGAALKTGTVAALRFGADAIVHVDADGQHDPSAIPSLIEPLRSGTHDIVFGSRFLGMDPEAIPSSRRALLIGARVFNRLALGIPRSVTDPQSGLRAMTAEAARSIPFSQDRMAHASEILRLVTRSRLRWMEVPARVRYTPEALAKGQRSSDALKIVWQLLMGSFQ